MVHATLTPPSTSAPTYRTKQANAQNSPAPDPPGDPLWGEIQRRGTIILVKALIHECLVRTPRYSESRYRFQELTWPEFQQLHGARDAFNSLPNVFRDRIETLMYLLEASQQNFQLWSVGSDDEMLFEYAEEPWAFVGF
ncbi:hypothetical protein K469DRAFT_684028 [Zopfia rhizophila CBS 207.26]|uniref:Uncharacterized protein n=1 Tax=Zopfia rhizophila CBS 207.26 TaxID=1314779 RepID=A0A6A6D8D4_9PEZI|nr:hypothetical protein K469DRAFT_684028 [Zopfia rhizophila CBS 207.26]